MEGEGQRVKDAKKKMDNFFFFYKRRGKGKGKGKGRWMQFLNDKIVVMKWRERQS